MVRVGIVREGSNTWPAKHAASVLIRIKTYRWAGIRIESQKLEGTSCARDSAALMLAHRNRHHTLLEDNPSSG
jgi:hypothetical protein